MPGPPKELTLPEGSPSGDGSTAPVERQLLHRNAQRFRGGLVFKAHRRVYHSNLGSREMKRASERDHVGSRSSLSPSLPPSPSLSPSLYTTLSPSLSLSLCPFLPLSLYHVLGRLKPPTIMFRPGIEPSTSRTRRGRRSHFAKRAKQRRGKRQWNTIGRSRLIHTHQFIYIYAYIHMFIYTYI